MKEGHVRRDHSGNYSIVHHKILEILKENKNA